MPIRPEQVRRDENNEGFDTSQALNDPKFLAFLDKLPDTVVLDQKGSEYAEKVRGLFDTFSKAEEMKGLLVNVFVEKVKAETRGHIVLNQEDFKILTEEIDREALDNPEALPGKLETIRRYVELPREIEELEKKIAEFGDLTRLNEQRRDILEEHGTLTLASKVSFWNRIKYFSQSYLNKEGQAQREIKKIFLRKMNHQFDDLGVGVGYTFNEAVEYIYLTLMNPGQEISPFVQRIFDRIGGIEVAEKILRDGRDEVNKKLEFVDDMQEAIKAGKKAKEEYGIERKMFGFGKYDVASQLDQLNEEYTELGRQIQTVEQLTAFREKAKNGHEQVREGLMSMYAGVQDISKIVKDRINEKFEQIISGANEPSRRPDEKERELEKAREFLDDVAEADGDPDYLEYRKAEVQQALEKVVADSAGLILDRVNTKKNGAFDTTLREITELLERPSVGEKTGDEAKEVVAQALNAKLEQLKGQKGNRAKVILIESALNRLGIKYD